MLRSGTVVWFVVILCGGLAPVSADETVDLAEYDARIVQSDREHWSYVPVTPQPLPEVENAEWVRTPIDQFVLAKLEMRGWSPAESATPEALLRRLYLDLIGLPPTLEERAAFLANPTPERLDAIAARLLNRDGYGERWARHWLDLVRYADTNGYERDATKPHVWRYRDYVIDALNNDKPYDRFVLEQLAGDELPDMNAETLIATGFYRLGHWDDEPADPEQDRHDQLDDMIRTVSQVFLGLTTGCARCHDHKFDAITMHDYYRFSALFAPLDRPRSGRTELDLPAGSANELARVADRDRQIAERQSEITQARNTFRQEFLESGETGFADDIVVAFLAAEADRNDVETALVNEHDAALQERLESALPEETQRLIADGDRQIAALREQIPDLPRGYFMRELPGVVPVSHLLLRGSAGLPGPEVQPGLPTVLVPEQPPFPDPGENSSGRRLTLARWISSPDNPLTARVIVNRVWQHHFGLGLVRTPSDFGAVGESPTHRELLDWLAYWFVHEAEWSLKKLHLLIVRSSTYRMSSAWRTEPGTQDPANRRLWRYPYRRLEVEAIRDSILAVSGQLNRQMHGPGVYLRIPLELLESHADKESIWQPFNEEQASRRTVYAFVKRSLLVPMLEVLDLCDTTRSTDVRNVTSVAPQALTLFNGEFVNRQAAYLAQRVEREVGGVLNHQIDRIWLLALCREPAEDERTAILDFVEQEFEQFRVEKVDMTVEEARRQAMVQVCRVVLNLNEFAYVE